MSVSERAPLLDNGRLFIFDGAESQGHHHHTHTTYTKEASFAAGTIGQASESQDRVGYTHVPSLDPARYLIAQSNADMERKSRTLVLCFDGTGDQFDDDVSSLTSVYALSHSPFHAELQRRPVSRCSQKG